MKQSTMVVGILVLVAVALLLPLASARLTTSLGEVITAPSVTSDASGTTIGTTITIILVEQPPTALPVGTPPILNDIVVFVVENGTVSAPAVADSVHDTFVAEATSSSSTAGLSIDAYVASNVTAPAPQSFGQLQDWVTVTTSVSVGLSVDVVEVAATSAVDSVSPVASSVDAVATPTVASTLTTHVADELILMGAGDGDMGVLTPSTSSESAVIARQGSLGPSQESSSVTSNPTTGTGSYTTSDVLSVVPQGTSPIGTGLVALAIAFEPRCNGACAVIGAPLALFPLGLTATVLLFVGLVGASLAVVYFVRHPYAVVAVAIIDVVGVGFIIVLG